jgi:hypothetical protein
VANKAKIEYDVDPGGVAEAKLRTLANLARQVGSAGGNAGGGGAGGGAGANPAAQQQRAFEALTRQIEASQRATLSLNKSFSTMSTKSPVASLRRDAAAAAAEAQRLQQQLIRLHAELNSSNRSRSIAQIKSDADQASRALQRLNQQHIKSHTEAVGAATKSGSMLGAVFSGNVLADFFMRGLSAAKEFTQEIIRAGVEGERTKRLMASTALQTDVDLAKIEKLARTFRAMGISTSQAREVASASYNAANLAGDPEGGEEFGRRFVDLAASRGRTMGEIAVMMRSIFTDDATSDKLLGRNPSNIQTDYAKKMGLGTSYNDLTDRQKNLAIVEAYKDAGLKVEGEAARKMDSVAGMVDESVASWEDLKTQLGEAAFQNGLFNDTLRTTIDIMKSFTATAPKPGETLADAQKRDAESWGKTFEDWVSDPVQYLGTTIAALHDLSAGGVFSPVEWARGYGGRFKEIAYSREIGVEERWAQNNRETQKREAAQGRWENGRRLTDEEFAEKRRRKKAAEPVEKTAAELRQEKAAAAKAEREERQREQEALREYVERQKSALQYVKSLREEVRGMRSELAGNIAGDDNPFVKTIADLETLAERTQKKWGSLGDEVVKQMERIQRMPLDRKLQEARLSSALSSLELQQQARRQLLPVIGMTGRDQRQTAVWNARTKNFESNQLRREASMFDRRLDPGSGGAGDVGGDIQEWQFQRRQFAELRQMMEQVQNDPALSPAGRRAAMASLDEQFTKMTEGRDMRALRNSGLPEDRALAAEYSNILRRKAERNDAAIAEEMARAAEGERAKGDVREYITRINDVRSGRYTPPSIANMTPEERRQLQDSALYDKALLAKTGTMDMAEKDADIRRAEYEAAEREALRRAIEEQEGREAVKESAKFLKGIDERLGGFIDALQGNISAKGVRITSDEALLKVALAEGAPAGTVGRVPEPEDVD